MDWTGLLSIGVMMWLVVGAVFALGHIAATDRDS
jgi:hypothetical protein